MKKQIQRVGLMALGLMISGCQTASQHAEEVRAANPDASRVTVGAVQKEIRAGMSGAEVLQALGSPNIVSTDEQRREVWVYDKISTTRVHSTSSGGVDLLLIGGGGDVGGGAGVGMKSSAGAVTTTQSTLTILIKFDPDRKVRDFSYHSSRF
ncbi:MAG: hypothetical protein HQL51_07665 [Magnetococcales bacterium]|nr:hypothetical protein [Magnetococcales bacterium]